DLADPVEGARLHRRQSEQIIDHLNLDRVNFTGFSEQADGQAQAAVQAFQDYLRQHADEIAALGFVYGQPWQRRALVLDQVQALHDALARPPLMLTTERLWAAYARVQGSQVKGAGLRRQLTDIVSLLRFAMGLDGELRPFADTVDRNFRAWVFRHNAQRATSFTPEQMEWLRAMKDHIAASAMIEADDLDYADLAARGGRQKAWTVFGEELDGLMGEMNVELVA
ncbi:MAG TPA: type I restriction-modification enzyme R subunit C-terminal domain-containing protein, partial [Accumulibacter sp.]|nr:type I restriction-modification enzyme R subunit C-terminal domain-containing protein [Accumulibacter sp.]